MCNDLQLFVWGIPSAIFICMFHPHSIWKGKYFSFQFSLSVIMYYCFKVLLFCFVTASVVVWQYLSLNNFFFFATVRNRERNLYCQPHMIRLSFNLCGCTSPFSLGSSSRVRTPKYFHPIGSDCCISYTAATVCSDLLSITLNPHICDWDAKESLKV